jgi:flagellar biosynthesis protein FlhA
MDSPATLNSEDEVRPGGETLVVLGVLGVLAVMLVPLPPLLLDVLLAFNVASSVLILLVALRLTRPLDFSVFPSLLLLTTLLRLGLNISTTRLILTHGGGGVGAAGEVIAAFGKFAAGGSLVVGGVVFLILMVVNFAVITKGSGRISEVAARFALDAMPGKQMAIDADLAAGLIGEADARKRRSQLEQEAEFFGAMDGASKFVRGDAVAGLVILVINLVGGLLVGVLRDGQTLASAASTYSVLTMGDGLVSQVPALMVSTAAGLVVTRAGDRRGLQQQVQQQVLAHSGVLRGAAGVLATLGLLPGMPTLAFGALAMGALALAQRNGRGLANKAAAEALQKGSAAAQEERPADLLAVETLEVQLGPLLVPLLESRNGGDLPARISNLRKQVAQDLGVVLPPVHLRDDLSLEPNRYRIMLRGAELGSGAAYADRLMALDAGGSAAPALEGIAEREPAFGLPARWITQDQRPTAEALGLTLVDASSVVTTHLSELVRRHAHDLVGRQEVQELLAITGKVAPKLVESVVPTVVSLGELVAVTRALLREGTSVRDFRTVVEAVADAAPRTKEPGPLADHVRRRLSRSISQRLMDKMGTVHVLNLARGTEDVLRRSMVTVEGEVTLAPDVESARRLVAQLERHASGMGADGLVAAVLAPADLRRPLFDLLARFVPDVCVVTTRELVPTARLQVRATLDMDQALA